MQGLDNWITGGAIDFPSEPSPCPEWCGEDDICGECRESLKEMKAA